MHYDVYNSDDILQMMRTEERLLKLIIYPKKIKIISLRILKIF